MKKIISLILAVLMIFSVTAMAVSAADEAQKPVKITFIYDAADSNGLAVERTKVIYVDYGEDYTKQAPKDTYVSDGYKYFISGWEIAGSSDRKVYENLPVIGQNDGITELTFKAAYGAEEITAGGVIGDAAEEILGGETVAFFEYLMQQLEVWFGKFILFLRNFL